MRRRVNRSDGNFHLGNARAPGEEETFEYRIAGVSIVFAVQLSSSITVKMYFSTFAACCIV